jgi:hypothetical protein
MMIISAQTEALTNAIYAVSAKAYEKANSRQYGR